MTSAPRCENCLHDESEHGSKGCDVMDRSEVPCSCLDFEPERDYVDLGGEGG